LAGAQLVNADLRYQVDLFNANLDHANLDGTHLDNANLREARLTNTCWGSATISKAILDKAHLEGADMLNVKGATWEQFTNAIWDDTTRLPLNIRAEAIRNNQSPGSLESHCEKQGAPFLQGYYDVGVSDCYGLHGWAWDMNRPDEPISVDIYDGKRFLETVVADIFRQDLLDAGKGNGKHGFFYIPPKDGESHFFRITFAGVEQELEHPRVSLKRIHCK
jgi:hypothetical protein